MKVIFYSAALLVIFSLSACEKAVTKVECTTKCKVCTKSNETDVNVCRGDWNSEEDYEAMVAVYKANGYDCSVSKTSSTKPATEEELHQLMSEGYTCI